MNVVYCSAPNIYNNKHDTFPCGFGWSCPTIATAIMTQAEEMVEDMQDLCHHQDHLAQEAGKAEEWEKMCR